MFIKRLLFLTLCCLVSLSLGADIISAQDIKSLQDVVGEAFGEKITRDRFNYYYKTAAIFTRSGTQDRSDEETRQEAWQNLIFRRAAQEEGIKVRRSELEEELKRLLNEKGIEKDTAAYSQWVKLQLYEDTSIFEHRIEDLLIINKFLSIKTNPRVKVTAKEAKQKFLNQYNSFESEYIKFENEKEARTFLKNVKRNPRLWKQTYDTKKSLGQKGAAWINIMALDALIDLWKIPKSDAYRILRHKEGDFIVAKFYYGDAVFRLLRKREAGIKEYDEKKKQYYKDMLTRFKTRRIVKDYFDNLFKQANYRDYVAENKQTAKIEELKNKSLVVLKTNRGEIELKLFVDIAPKTCENFIGLVEKGYYDDTIFHRIIKDFMIQGGDPTGTGTGGESIWGEAFSDEMTDKVSFDRQGLLAMANSGPNTNKSQFFITVKPVPRLNKKHTIFGEVISGYRVVEKINNIATDSNDKPKKVQKIIKAYIKTRKTK